MKKNLLNILSLAMFIILSACMFTGCFQKPNDPNLETPQAPPPAYIREGDYIYFGEYPQSLKASNVTVSEFVDNNGYYIGSDGARYVKQTAIKSYHHSNETTMVIGQEYYFKVEKLKWRILKEESGKALLVCDTIIDTLYFQPNISYDDWYNDPIYATDGTNILVEEDGVTQVYANNYKYSELRRFLTQDFYIKAFNAEQKSLINLTTVDNSAATTENPTNIYACANTEDYIFALSYQDVHNTAYGFTTGEDRCWYASDFAKASGIQLVTEKYIQTEWDPDNQEILMQYLNGGLALLRSPYIYPKGGSISCSIGGMVSSHYIDQFKQGVVPALYINL